MKRIAITLCAAAIAFSLISCGSKPEPEQEVEPQAPVVEETKTPEPEPEPEPEPAPVVIEEPQEPEPEPELIDNTETLKKLDSLREEAIKSGVKKYAVTELAEIDALYNNLKKRALAGEDVAAESEELMKLYEILTVYAKALELKDKIDKEDLAQYAQNIYDDGESLIDEIDDSDEWTVNLLDKAKDAYSKFNTVSIQGYKALARQARDEAFSAKRDADSVKAGVAKKEKYNQAADFFKLADSLYAMQSPEKAISNYNKAAVEFEKLYKELKEARAAAERAIEAAKQKVAESELYAVQADTEAPIAAGSEAEEYIEDEDAVLLDADNYENPEDAEADISEDFDFGEDDDDDEEEAL